MSFFDQYDKTIAVDKYRHLNLNKPLSTNALPGMLGLELEIEGNNLPTDGAIEKIKGSITGVGWAAITDGSLRGESREYILTGPALRGELPTLVGGLFDVFKVRGTTLNNSNRCSTHVHVNMKGKKINNVTSAYAVWAMFEDLLIQACGTARQTNHFCLGTKDTMAGVKAWTRYLLEGRGRDFDRNLKYSAFNFLPLFNKGSIEIRCGKAADSTDDVIPWAQTINDLVDYAVFRYHDPSRIANDLSERGGNVILAEILQDVPGMYDKVTDGLGAGSVDDAAMTGFRRVQEMVLGVPWQEYIPLINKVFVPNPFGDRPKKTVGIMPRGFDRVPTAFEELRIR